MTFAIKATLAWVKFLVEPLKRDCLKKFTYLRVILNLILNSFIAREIYKIVVTIIIKLLLNNDINRPGKAGAVLQTPL